VDEQPLWAGQPSQPQPLELFVFVDDTQPATDTAKVRIAHVAPCAQALHADDRALMNYLLRR
jgi:hypothetical protein